MAAQEEADELASTVDSLVETSNAIPEEAFDDPSVVRHVEALGQSAKRARRESNALQRKVASGYVTLTRRR